MVTTARKMQYLNTLTGVMGILLFGLLAEEGYHWVQTIAAERPVVVDRRKLRAKLLTLTTCSETVQANGCVPGRNVPLVHVTETGLKRRLIGPTGTRWGTSAAVARCNHMGTGIEVRLVHLSPNMPLAAASKPADYLPDPWTGEVYTLNDEASLLFSQGLYLCARSKQQNQASNP